MSTTKFVESWTRFRSSMLTDNGKEKGKKKTLQSGIFVWNNNSP
jgi:hypothetical protein